MEIPLSARHKLNSAAIGAAIIVAAIAGAACESWTVFLIATVVLIAMGLHAGDIRPDKRR
jgi:hypothetical protein